MAAVLIGPTTKTTTTSTNQNYPSHSVVHEGLIKRHDGVAACPQPYSVELRGSVTKFRYGDLQNFFFFFCFDTVWVLFRTVDPPAVALETNNEALVPY
jgi:hypothetical protein